ncbi:MAG: hypothetical protein QM817_29070 [Archangium sp.]
MSSRSVVLALVALAFAACPPLENPPPADGGANDAGVVPDAGDVDAGVDAGSLDLDYRLNRGAPWTLHHGSEISGAPFAVTNDAFAVQTRCDGGACDYEWRNEYGALINRRENLRGLFGMNVARHGHAASLYEIRNTGTCVDSLGESHRFFEGDWHLLDVETGNSFATLPNISSGAFLDSAFLRSGLHARLLPNDPTACSYTPVLRSTSAPFGMPPGQNHIDAASWIEDELSDGRLLVSGAPEKLEVLAQSTPIVRGTISNEATAILVTNGFAHAFERQPVQAVASYEYATHRTVRTSLPWMQKDHLVRVVSGRFFVLCGGGQPLTRCEVHDGRGELAVSSFEVSRRGGVLPIAVAADANILVYWKTNQVLRRNLLTGVEDVVSTEGGTLRTVGNGGGVLLTSAARAVAIDSERAREIPGRLSAVVEVGGDLPQSQTVLIISSSESGGAFWLTAWNVESSRLARLTDSLQFNPPLTAASNCNAPGFVRVAGEPADSAFVESSLLHFTEFVPQEHPVVRLFVMPADLSSAPRLIAETIPDSCGTPLVTRDGSKIWFPVPTSAGSVKTTWAVP